ncbi:MAG: nucleotidyltransferase family protein [Verrucomicrobia bacterium]|nr:nucleotidyltransferase family protein [Verrucomicrobiota bacterium]
MTAATSKFLKQLEEHQTDLRRFGVRRIGLFGSCARGEESADSDVDLLVHFEPRRKTLANLVELGDFLEALFQRRVELVTPESLSPYLGPNILREVQYPRLRRCGLRNRLANGDRRRARFAGKAGTNPGK